MICSKPNLVYAGRVMDSTVLYYSGIHSDVKRGQNVKAKAETEATCRYVRIRTHGDNAKNTNEFVSHIRVLNHVFVMNVAMIQPRNGYNQHYYAPAPNRRGGD